MMFPDIEGERQIDNKTILTMDIKFLNELWSPGNLVFFSRDNVQFIIQIT